MINFYCTWYSEMKLNEFRKFCYLVGKIKIQYKGEETFKFVKFIDQRFKELVSSMESTDIIPIARAIYRGPKMRIPSVY